MLKKSSVWLVVLIAVVAIAFIATGCAKKQVVKEEAEAKPAVEAKKEAGSGPGSRSRSSPAQRRGQARGSRSGSARAQNGGGARGGKSRSPRPERTPDPVCFR